jgi:transaldolase
MMEDWSMSGLEQLKVKLFADGADLDGIRKLAAQAHIKGFTTNPSLMRKAGIKNYQAFAIEALEIIGDRPISLEVFADDLPTMAQQARAIASWGPSIYVKIPVQTTQGLPTAPLLHELAADGIKLNVTAIFTLPQVEEVSRALSPDVPAFVSVFAGRMADVGVDPLPIMQSARAILEDKPQAELLWAATREVFNIIQADRMGCAIITVPNDILAKLANLGRSLEDCCTDTVVSFYRDGVSAGFTI